MKTIVITDIFGKTPALQALARAISPNHFIIDPYEGEDLRFKSEDEAYQFFTSNIGLDNYAKRADNFLSEQGSAVNVVGFSVGASAIWNLSTSSVALKVNYATCFYGSQIRYSTAVSPLFPVTLIFPSMEKHFSVNNLISELRATSNTQVRQVAYLHGFMNKLSTNFDPKGYSTELKMLAERANQCV